ncbi:PEP/pyruvate-binding domain-containing protein [Candidatus Nitrospira nitrificans]|uniref:Putative Phosphoenolpyruvate synthase n=1 Tax=Candidatus Nitrospira nitrificans TaxID=1742973 RepID=A0A0S4LCZ4_9BACT|nr:PEP/pyruvate-binding domain-containing protein [Candidatus Nitrospira nitrificans]CUS35491.1 putative Phosphoenolpyruvate synthase [Candidatus Nitrospira nitrificans]
MTRPFIVPLSQCTDLDLVGGKALGLARLIAAGFSVPQGLCITTAGYIQCLHASGFIEHEEWRNACALSENERASALADCRVRMRRIETSHLAAHCLTALQALHQPPNGRWAVRSSATNEDTAHASFAGLYRTHLGVALFEIDTAIKDLWASLWEERVVNYVARLSHRTAPRMAVVIQPMVEAQSAGVAYSIHPVTGRSNQVTINAVLGLAAPLVDGTVKPDQYVVEVTDEGQPTWVRRRVLAHKSDPPTVGKEGLRTDPLSGAITLRSSLTDVQLFSLARTAKRIERAFGQPMDLEWAFDTRQLWIVQARPITAVRPSSDLTNDDCEWSRTNFKETLPELPSLLSLSFLERFMDAYILSHYRRLGCRIPDGLTAVRVLKGRPYLNVTLFHILIAQLRGDPSMNTEQMGGEPLQTIPRVQPLDVPAFVRAGWMMWGEMRRVQRQGPRVFEEMKALAATYRRDHILPLSVEELVPELDKLGSWLEGREVTFGIAGGVGQCLQIFSQCLPRWLGPDWRSLLNAALQGQGTVISAQQILRLAELTDIARHEAVARAFLTSEPWNPATFRVTLAGSAFLHAFDRYLEDYGHRAVGESDVMAPRLADNPESILAILRAQLISAAPSQQTVRSRQDKTKTAALDQIKRRIGWRLDRWAIFLWCYRRLCRFFALREANRHHLMYYSTAIRTLLLRLGELLVGRGQLNQRDDIFFLTINDRADLLAGSTRDWKAVINARRTERECNAAIEVPDTIHDWETASEQIVTSDTSKENGTLSGTPISVGTVAGPVRIIRSVADWSRVMPGEILVVSVIDPGLAPLFGLAGGLIAEMGGTLSHGAIIAREYGLPTIANVEGAMARLSDEMQVTIDAGAGTIRIEPFP